MKTIEELHNHKVVLVILHEFLTEESILLPLPPEYVTATGWI